MCTSTTSMIRATASSLRVTTTRSPRARTHEILVAFLVGRGARRRRGVAAGRPPGGGGWGGPAEGGEGRGAAARAEYHSNKQAVNHRER